MVALLDYTLRNDLTSKRVRLRQPAADQLLRSVSLRFDVERIATTLVESARHTALSKFTV